MQVIELPEFTFNYGWQPVPGWNGDTAGSYRAGITVLDTGGSPVKFGIRVANTWNFADAVWVEGPNGPGGHLGYSDGEAVGWELDLFYRYFRVEVLPANSGDTCKVRVRIALRS